MSSERQHTQQQLANYGTVMREAFKHMIALKRWEQVGMDKMTPPEKVARGVSIHSMARFRRLLQPDDWDKVKAFTAALSRVNLADKDDNIIDDVMHGLGLQRLST